MVKMSKKLFLIEAPGKVKKLRQILGPDYIVKSSGGHIRELAKDGEDNLGFDLEGGKVKCRFVPRSPQARKTIASLKKLAGQVETVILATDEDREGEMISWHLKEALRLRNPQRVTYREITPAAVRAALARPRSLDLKLIHAGMARSVLDKLVGFRGSPLIWKLNNGAKSIGRVQSAALHILCQRERQIQDFQPSDYWVVWVDYTEGFRAYYLGQNASTQISPEEDNQRDDALYGDEQKIEATKVLSEAEAHRLVEIARQFPHQVVSQKRKTVSKKPPAPFTTSSLQQAAGSRLGWSPEKTMQVAQRLYESGHITYMRTDSTQMEPQFCATVRQWLEEKDPSNVPAKVASHRQSKRAQEAHEAIRPTELRKPSSELREELSAEEWELYLLIWLRTVASQCKPAQIVKTRIITQSGRLFWLARGQVVAFWGYAKYWKDIGTQEILPDGSAGQPLHLKEASQEKKQTQPPPCYTEAKLVQIMERRGIGRPSTFATTVKTLKEREYASLQKRKLRATPLGLDVDGFLQKTLPELLEADFTAEMEDKLDAIAAGFEDWEGYITGWNRDYLAPALTRARLDCARMSSEASEHRQAKESEISCPQCGAKMTEVPSRSKKLHKNHFLKCPGCSAVMFYNRWSKSWELPRDKEKAEGRSLKLTDYPCPVCGKKLAEREYEKDGNKKRMLVCSSPQSRGDKKHKTVVYFESKGVYWSKKHGELPIV